MGDWTELHIRKCYLNAEVWSNKCPEYYIEVKTATRDCSEQLYMTDLNLTEWVHHLSSQSLGGNVFATADAEGAIATEQSKLTGLCDHASLQS